MIHWSELVLFGRDNQPITDSERVRAALDEFRRTNSMNGVFFGRLGLPHEDEEDASTWGPKSPEHVDWTGFPIKPITSTIHSHSAFHDITLCIREDEVIVSGGIDQDAAWSAAVEETGGYADEEAGLERNPALAEETYREVVRDILDDVAGALVETDIVAGDLVFRDHDSYCEYVLPLKDRRSLRLRAHYYDGNFDAEIEEEE